MSEADSFIEEVSEEVRRDKLFALMKKYGWIAILAVLLLVGGAAFNEWRKARAQAEAEAFGDQVLAALNSDDRAKSEQALEKMPESGAKAAIVLMLAAREAAAAGNRDAAVAALDKVAADQALPERWRHLAILKSVLLRADDLSVEQISAQLEPLRTPGAPYRLLADEQVALALVAAGKKEEALPLLQSVADDQEATQALRRRATQLIVALGGAPTQEAQSQQDGASQ